MANLLRRSCKSLFVGTSDAVSCARVVLLDSHIKRKHDFVDKVQDIEVDPERLKQIEESPSGWVPPAEKVPEFPFFIKRSKMNNLPVYTDFRGGGTKDLTIIRKIKGDLRAVEALLRNKLDKDLVIQLNELTGQVKIKGNHKDRVVTFLKELGF